jgi:hypothetical protein
MWNDRLSTVFFKRAAKTTDTRGRFDDVNVKAFAIAAEWRGAAVVCV